MKKEWCLYLFAFFIFLPKLYAQKTEIDSLVHSLPKITDAKQKIDILLEINLKYNIINPDSSLYYAQKAEKSAQEVGDQNRKALAINRIGVSYWSKGDLAKALNYFKQSIELAQQIKDQNIIARNIYNIGAIYFRLGMYKEAMVYSTQALKIFEQSKDVERIAVATQQIGTIYNFLNKPDSAIYFLEKALPLIQKQIPIYLPFVWKNIGEAQWKKKQSDQAKKSLEKAILFAEKYSNIESLPLSYCLLAEIDLANGDLANATLNAQKAIQTAEGSQIKNQMYQAYNIYSKILERKQDWQTALKYKNLYISYKDSVQSQTIKHNLQIFEYEKKQNEIAHLLAQQAQKTTNQQLWFASLTVTLSIVSIFSILIFQNRKKIQKAYNKLSFANQEIQLHKEELLATNDELAHNVEELQVFRETLQKQNQQILAINNALAESMMTSITDLKGNILSVNQRFCEISQYQENELLGQNHRIINSGIHPKEFWIKMWQTIINGKTWRSEVKNRAKDGTYFWVDTVITPIFNPDGEICQFLAIRNNITQQKEAEDALKKSKQEYENLVQMIPVGVYKYAKLRNGEIKFLYASPKLCEAKGLKAKDILKKPELLAGLIHPEDKSSFIQTNQKALDNAQDFVWEGRVIVKGQILYVHIESRVQKMENGDLIWNGIEYDITERKQAEAQLLAERTLLRTIIDNVPVNIYVKDRQSRKILANRAEYEYLGAKNEAEILNKNDYELYSKTIAEISIEEDLRVINSGQAMLNHETFSINKQDEKQWFLVSKIPFKNQEGEIMGLVGISYNFTERKISEEKLQQTLEKLRIAQHTLQKQKEATEAQAQALTESNQAKDKIFSMIAHDLRSPLASLKSIFKLLSDRNLSQEEFYYLLPNLNKRLNHTFDITEELLYWARNQMDAVELNLEQVNVAKMIHEEIERSEDRAKEKGVLLKSQLPDNLQDAKADEDTVKTILRNLVSNAIKFCRKNDQIILIAENTNDFVKITVRDTGVGISPKNLSKIFHSNTFTTLGTNQEKGTGLGLMLCKEFVEKNGGEIWAESEPDKGTKFSFTLPIFEKRLKNN